MRILVPIKQIQDPAGLTVNRKVGRVFVNREGYMMNPASKCALEAALRIAEAEVVAVAFGGEQAIDALGGGRGRGAGRAILISEERIDSGGVARAFKALIDYLGGVDLVLNGHRTLDTGQSSGARLAEALNWPYLGEAVECRVEGSVARVARSTTGDGYQAYEADLPAVVTVTSQGPKPRYAHGGDIITAYRDPKAYETLTLEDLGVTEMEVVLGTAERGQSFPPEREFGRMMSVDELAALIRAS